MASEDKFSINILFTILLTLHYILWWIVKKAQNPLYNYIAQVGND